MKDHLQPTEMVEQPHGGALRRGNPGNVGSPGRPSLRIRRKAKNLYDDTLDAMRALLDEHNKAVSRGTNAIGAGRLSVSELKAICQETKGIGLGDLKEVQIEDESFLMALEETIFELVEDGTISGLVGMQIQEKYLSKVKDV